MPSAIFLYEIDSNFGPNVIGEYYLDKGDKVPSTILKEFVDKHIKKEFKDVTTNKDNIRYYSCKLNAQTLNKDNLFLGFILREQEDLISIKSLVKKIEEKIIQNFANEKQKMDELLKNHLNSIFTLMQKLKEPIIIKETINEKTKVLLDQEKFQEARVLIDLGEKIPEKLSAEVKLGEQFLMERDYKKAKRCFLKAAELASEIQEYDIVSFLENKVEQISSFPDLEKERDNLLKDLEKLFNELANNKLYLYGDLGTPIDKLLYVSSTFEENELTEILTELRKSIHNATQLAKELYRLDKKIREQFNKI